MVDRIEGMEPYPTSDFGVVEVIGRFSHELLRCITLPSKVSASVCQLQSLKRTKEAFELIVESVQTHEQSSKGQSITLRTATAISLCWQ
jgi:hypothetical protein